MSSVPTLNRAATHREWIPVSERLPEVEGIYATLVKPLLDPEPYEQHQKYTPMAHPGISGWQYGQTTHWRSSCKA